MNKENQHKEALPYGVVSNDGINLYNGDCLEVMDYLISQNITVDAIITDPPYGQLGTTACKWDSIIPFDEMWKRLNKLIKPNGAIVLFGSEPFSSALRMSNIKNYKYDWKWDKVVGSNFINANKMPLKVYEDICVFYKKLPNYNPQMVKRDVSKIRKNSNGKSSQITNIKPKGSNKCELEKFKYPTNKIEINRLKNELNRHHILHPTQKPIALMEYLIKTYTKENETVLDFTMGSGSTGVACKSLNRNFIGIELDDKYFEIAEERIKNAKKT